ncbi:sulfite reductase subunit alpha [soil metagenome]
MTTDLSRWALAGALLLVWLLLGAWWMRPARRVGVTGDATLILHASQTGQALELAQMTLRRLLEGGQNAVLMPLGHAQPAHLAACENLLVIAATTGLGEPPDEARAFAARMAQRPDLSATRYAMLALGDRKFEDFCSFGRRVDAWLGQSGAKPLHDRIEVDDLDPQALRRWDAVLDALGAVETKPESLYQPWQVTMREHLNPLPAGADPIPALWRIALEPAAGALPDWQAGDLFEVMTPSGHRRDYSVASLPDEGGVILLVRAVQDEAGKPGEGSGLLIAADSVAARLRDHAPFHAPSGDGALLLIAAGSGFAGIRPHALNAMRGGRPVWIILGERHPDIDAATVAEARGWDGEDRLHRLDLAFSRADEGRRYVQHVIAAEGGTLVHYLGEGGAVMLCGGLTMGKAVEAAIDAALGEEWRITARAEGRYHADLY